MAPRRTAQVAITALLLLGCAYVLSPFFAAILFAGTVAITSWPLYARLHGALRGRDGLAAISMTLLLTALLAGVFGAGVGIIAIEWPTACANTLNTGIAGRTGVSIATWRAVENILAS